ncbi:efflux RND transporter permease subunit [Luteolibacter yonseiensis]|uniref:Efflux RND transporter permease subunit n=1 Tax=Luteolibacter yonseiensis TaxID=1144680 RepID=A0A934VDR6_9BACT|nr:efflux RND transporter permease subunit [Luteolibacter yonseiensis]MBK1818316.1 efflux RND transporter permease subunit [Luteolibacter yonseiensis]
MWIVLFALRYKYTIGVLAILILLFGIMSGKRMSTDILPRVDSPEITLVWNYNGLNAAEMASKITSFSEIATLNNVDDLQEVRSETSNGIGLVKLRFQPYVNINTAMSQVTGVSQTILRRMPTGTTPPLVIRTSPSSVPIVQLVMSSDTMTSGQLFDYSRLALRAQLQSVPGMRISLPYGGAARQIMVDLDPDALNAYGLSAAEITAAVSRQNLTLPSGSLREGGRELPIEINASPETIQAFLDLPLRSVEGKMILLRDVANVRDGEAVSTNIARLNGQNAVMISILKLGSASTVDIIDGIMERLPEIRASAPPGMKIEPIFDQSIFVRAAVKGVEHEILLVGGLVACVVLLFLGSWRSTLIVLTSIPLALLCSIFGLSLMGATFNLMTLGGLALAIGILVDNSLVEIENIKRQIALGKDVRTAIIDGAREVAFPEFVSTISICIVFLPIFLLSGTSSYVFRPLALAVVFAMIASYLLARTLVPTLASIILPAELRAEKKRAGRKPGGLFRIHHAIEHGVDRLAETQGRILGFLLRHKWIAIIPVLVAAAIGGFSALNSGREFFPKTDAGLIRLFVRTPSGIRIEDTAQVMADIQREVRGLIPKEELQFVVENIGTPSSVNQAWVETTAISSADGEILVQLADEHGPSEGYVEKIRTMLAEKFPTVQFFFRPADATSQTLASGAPTTFEVRLMGRDVPGNLALARELKERFAKVPGAVDVTLREVLDQPGYALRIDRARAASFGINAQDAANALLAALGSGGSVAPNFWSDPATGAAYDVQVLAPPASLKAVEQLLNLPIRPSTGGSAAVPLRSFATVVEKRSPASVSRTSLQPTFTVVANASGRDLGSITADLENILTDLRKKLKPANIIELTGQAALMETAYGELIGGLGLAAFLVLLVMVVNFQSWTLPFVAIAGLPVSISGALFGLWITGTPLSVPALMGIIMVVGVSTANSVLVSSFARDRVDQGETPHDAAIEAATTRLRPVMMTALAMILGVIPMALGHAEGGEQNAPLGRAVIGGLLFGTFASLFLVPVAFAAVRGYTARRELRKKEEDADAPEASETSTSPVI